MLILIMSGSQSTLTVLIMKRRRSALLLVSLMTVFMIRDPQQSSTHTHKQTEGGRTNSGQENKNKRVVMMMSHKEIRGIRINQGTGGKRRERGRDSRSSLGEKGRLVTGRQKSKS